MHQVGTYDMPQCLRRECSQVLENVVSYGPCIDGQQRHVGGLEDRVLDVPTSFCSVKWLALRPSFSSSMTCLKRHTLHVGVVTGRSRPQEPCLLVKKKDGSRGVLERGELWNAYVNARVA